MQSISTRFLALFGILAFLAGAYFAIAPMVHAAAFPQQSAQPVAYASTTAYAIAQSSTRVIATSTRNEAVGFIPATNGRTGVTFQAVNCVAGGGSVYLSFNDLPAVGNTGFWLAASSSVTFSDSVPNVYGSVRAIAPLANCALLVTEYRSPN